MKVLRIVGPSDSGKTTFIERLAERLSSRGRVGTIKHIRCEPTLDTEGKDTARHRAAGAEVTYGMSTNHGWFATGDGRSLSETLDRLAVSCDYALVEGFSDARLPTVALGDDEAEETLASGRTADDIDVDGVLEAISDVDSYETLESLVSRVEESSDADRAGAIATFVGRVRTRDHPDDDPTEYLEFERYDGVAADRMRTIEDELCTRERVHKVLLHHKVGVVEAGDDIVYVVVLAGHRAEAFRAVEDGIDRLKEEVPLFKKEVTVSDEYWAHESDR